MKNNHVSQTILRREIDCMIDCYMDELFSTFDKKEIIGIYVLGSANRKWDSEIDYIPGMSDIDLNIYVKHPDKINNHFASISNALKFSSNVEKKYIKKIHKPVHIPRLHAQLHNIFLDNYPHSLAVASTVKTIYGASYKQSIPKKIIRNGDSRKQILEYKNYLNDMPMKVMSANSYRMIRYLHEIYYRTSNSIRHVLMMKNKNFDEVMSLNKTRVITKLKSQGYNNIAKEYESMLKNCYKYCVKDDMTAAHNAIVSGYNSLKMAIEIAEKKN